MSSLIVADVSLVKKDDNGRGQSFEWIVKRILDLISSIERRYESLKCKNERIIALHEEFIALAQSMVAPQYPGWRTIESSKKALELFFRKADRLRIVLIQMLLEENEMRLVEDMYARGIERYLSQMLSESFLTADDPEYKKITEQCRAISRIEPDSDRIAQYKSFIADLATRYYSGRYAMRAVLERIEEAKKEISSLKLCHVSLSDLHMLHELEEQVSALASIPQISLRKEYIVRIEEQLSAIRHRTAGIEHVPLGDLQYQTREDEHEKYAISHDVSVDLMTLEAEYFHDRIRFFDYDQTESGDYEPVALEATPERRALQRDNLQLEYGLLKEKIPEKTVIREELEEIIQNLSFEPDAGALLDAAMLLSHDPFPEMRELLVIRRQYILFYLQKKSKSLSDSDWDMIIHALLEVFFKLGYRLKSRNLANFCRSVQRGVVEVFSPMPHYSLMISLNSLDELVFRRSGLCTVLRMVSWIRIISMLKIFRHPRYGGRIISG